MKYAAFFRNLNLGRANCPTKAQLESAFIAAGASEASSFLTNGTLVFSIKNRRGPAKLLAEACRILHAECGLREPGFVRSLPYLAELVARDPFVAIDRSTVYECCISFLHADVVVPEALPLVSKRLDVEVLQFTDGEAFSLCRKVGNSPGSPNAFLEKRFGLPATTRAWNTVVRLVNKHG